jgi:hypothetical protein
MIAKHLLICEKMGVEPTTETILTSAVNFQTTTQQSNVSLNEKFVGDMGQWAMSSTNLSFEQTKFDCCGRKIDR